MVVLNGIHVNLLIRHTLSILQVDKLNYPGWFKLIMTELYTPPHEKKDATPRASQSSSRTSSVGSFLKSELFGENSESELCFLSPPLVQTRDLQNAFNLMDMELLSPFTLADLSPKHDDLPNTPRRRRQSKGRKLMSKAFDSLGNARSKSMHFLRSKSSKDSLLRQVSLRNLESSRLMSSETSSRNSSRFSFEQDSVSIPDSASNPIIIADAPHMSPTPSFILYPEISVFPEVDSVDVGDEASIWVAVVITGVLRKTIECQRIPDLAGERSGMSSSGMKSGE
jgi:hypothetical protein